MTNQKLKLSILWICLMLIYLLGDVMRIFAGDFDAGSVDGYAMSQGMLLIAAIVLAFPIIMSFLTQIMSYMVNKWTNMIVTIFLFAFNFSGLWLYPSLYDRFLIGVGLVINIMIFIYAISLNKKMKVG